MSFILANEKLVDNWNEGEALGEFKVESSKQRYLKTQYDAEEMDTLFNHDISIWGRHAIEGVMLRQKLNIEKIYVIEINTEFNYVEPLVILQVITQDKCKTRPTEQIKELLANCNIPILIVDKKTDHFVLLLPLKLKDSSEREIFGSKSQPELSVTRQKTKHLPSLRKLAFEKSVELLSSIRTEKELDEAFNQTKGGSGEIAFPSEFSEELKKAIKIFDSNKKLQAAEEKNKSKKKKTIK
jgi:hypothetical protein